MPDAEDYPDHAEGARRRIPDGPSPPLAALVAPARRSCACATRSSTAIRDFFDERGFTLVDAPIFTPNACEGTSTLFETKYFDEGKAYLTQSGQLYSEAGAVAFGKVYCFGPTFRAEKSKTGVTSPSSGWSSRRSPSWTWKATCSSPRISCTMSWARTRRAQDEFETLAGDQDKDRLQACERVLKPFRRMHYDEAAKILDKYWDEKLASGEELPPTFKRFQYGDDFGAYDEVALTSLYEEPVIVHHYPAAVKAFYMKRDPNEPDKALAMDVLFPEFGEIIGGSQREDSDDEPDQAARRARVAASAFEWFLDLRKYGSVPHAGFGLGLERLVMWLCDLEHIREAIPFPRTLTRIWP